MIYVGVVAQAARHRHGGGGESASASSSRRKRKPPNLNLAAVQAGYDYAAANLTKQDPFWIERMDKTQGKIIIDGNSAAALGCMFAGVTVVTWYPITPSSSLVETLIDYMKEYRIGPDGKATFAIVQAEDELAAIGMVIGAGWAGARSMTATAGPGISLMAEFAGLGYYAEVPGVIWDIQRVGPSTGLPTRTSQGDILSTAFLSHGDTKHILLFPCSAGRMLQHGERRVQSGGTVPDAGVRDVGSRSGHEQLDVGSVRVSGEADQSRQGADARKIWTGWAGFARYKDVDGDGVGYRTLPGTEHPAAAYFARGSGHNEKVAIQRAAGRFRKQHGAHQPEVRDGALVCSAAG